MNPDTIPAVVAMLMVFGMPVAIVYVIKHFKLKERELQLEAGLDAEDRFKKLEGRLDRMEKLLGSVQSEIRALPPAASPPPAPLAPKAEHLYLPAPPRDETKG
jgi:hypothetical protein